MTYSGLLDHRGRPIAKKSYLSTVEDAGRYVGGPDTFGDWEARRFRAALFKALWENNAYDGKLHSWADSRNRESGLYKYERGTHNPAYRLAEIFATHLFNGAIDARAGDGKSTPSALPILTENEEIRRPIARLWRDSNWQVNKAILGRTGTVVGDAAVVLNDDVRKRRVVAEPIDTSCLRHVGRDHQGNVTDYVRQEYRPNPDYQPARRFAEGRAGGPASRPDERRYALYTEVCHRDGETVVYRTYKGDDLDPYNWRGEDADGDPLPPQWEVDYGFVPMVVIPHIQPWAGRQWGYSEYSGLLTKIDEVNDLGSKLHDQIRKCVEGMWFFAGVDHRQRRDLVVERPEATDANPQPGRQEMPTIYAGMGATATPLVIPLDIQFASMEILNQKAELEQDSPVLRFDRARSQVSGDASAKALREVRKPAEAAIQERRAGYDDLMVRVHKMAISLGSMRGYPEYEGFTPESYESGDLDHAIGPRSVYGVDPLDEAELRLARGNAVAVWVNLGVPVRLALEMEGWGEEQLASFDEAKDAQAEEDRAKAEADAALQVKVAAATKPPSPAANGRPQPAVSPN